VEHRDERQEGGDERHREREASEGQALDQPLPEGVLRGYGHWPSAISTLSPAASARVFSGCGAWRPRPPLRVRSRSTNSIRSGTPSSRYRSRIRFSKKKAQSRTRSLRSLTN